MTYMYEVTVTIPPGRYLDVTPGDSGIINVEGEHPTRLSVPTDDDETRLYLTGQGFPSAEGAREAAADARSALRLAALAADVPMNVGSGGDVRIQRSSAVNLRARAVGRVHRPAGEFVDHVRTALNAEREIGAKEALAIDLFLAASFESSIRARFVTLVTALEALSARQARPDAVGAHVDHLRELTAEAMRNADSGEERESYDRLRGRWPCCRRSQSLMRSGPSSLSTSPRQQRSRASRSRPSSPSVTACGRTSSTMARPRMHRCRSSTTNFAVSSATS